MARQFESPRLSAVANPNRDYNGDMNERFRTIQSEPHMAASAAELLVNELLRDDPDLLVGWLRMNAPFFVHEKLRERNRRARGTMNRRIQNRSIFRAAVKAHEEGDSTQLRGFLTLNFVIESGETTQLGKMRAVDVKFVANRYGSQERSARFYRLVLEKIGDKLGDTQTVEDVYTEEQLANIFRTSGS